jgi:glucokinase
MNPEPYVLGLDLGGSSVKAVAVTPAGRTCDRFLVAFDPTVPGAFAATVRGLAERATRDLGRPLRIGVSAPGLADREGRSIAFMPGRLDGLVGLDWGRHLGREDPVPVLNDAHAALAGEAWLGAARGLSNVLLLTLGTGVGGAAMVDGRLLRGHSGKAGHLGHLSLNPEGAPGITGIPGSLEDAIGNHNIAARSGGRFATTHDLIRAHEAGDAEATAVWDRSVRALAAAIASFTNILDPEAVILGGGIARSGETLLAPLRRWVDRFEWKVCGRQVRLLPAELGDLAGAYGAAWQALPAPASAPPPIPLPSTP